MNTLTERGQSIASMRQENVAIGYGWQGLGGGGREEHGTCPGAPGHTRGAGMEVGEPKRQGCGLNLLLQK